jgi:pimeloyl-ACP methyl ester carboxylesterase
MKPAAVMEQYFNVGGLRTYVETVGVGETILLLHGGLITKETLSNQADELSKKHFVVLPERRGHGRTDDLDEDFTYENMANDTIALMKKLEISKAVLCGHSDGANTAMLIAIKHPELVRSLVLISGNFNYNFMSEEERNALRAMTPDDFRNLFPKWTEVYMRVVPNSKERFPKLCEKVKKLWTSNWSITTEELARISCPVLVMSGDRDLVPLSHTLELFQSIKKSELCVVPGTTHDLIEEKPTLVNAAILDFLNQG